jgi:AbrB family looped-hinge helix DNA binding protein
MTIVAKITSKGQTTIPAEIRKALDAKPGDMLAWDVKQKGEVVVRRVRPVDVEYLKAVSGTLSEWDSEADDRAYRDL